MQIEQKTITSVEVAEMVGKEHSKLLRDIRGYMEHLDQSKIGSVEFFTDGEYKDLKGEARPCFEVTRKGCEFISNKLTGVKGTAFTARYINVFHAMESSLLVNLKNLSPELQAIFEHDKKIQIVFDDIRNTEKRIDSLEDNLPLFNIECKELQTAVRRVGILCLGGKTSPAYKDNSLRGRVYSDIQTQLLREFALEKSYMALKHKQLDQAMQIINAYKLPYILSQDIASFNSQIAMEV